MASSAAAKSEVAKLRSRPLGRAKLIDLAIVLALAGDNSGALRLAETLAKKYPMNTLLNTIELPTIRAILDMNYHRYDEAIRGLEAVRTYGSRRSDVLYVRGTAYLRAAKGSEAVQEFQRIIDNRICVGGCPPVDPLVPLARLRLGRAYTIQGETVKARTAYQDFFAH
jgi:predicted Zn-dependent protease